MSAERLVRAAREAGVTIGTAESCTGGLIGAALTSVPGSSAVFPGGLVTYSNQLKQQLLNVPASDLREHGAVSEVVARAMAQGARRALGCDYAVAVTGIAGPGGGSEAKPVGTVHVAVAGPEGVSAWHDVWSGLDREGVREATVDAALSRLLDALG